MLILPYAGRPVNVVHRRSLSNVFKTVKAKYSRDKLDKNEIGGRSPEVMEVLESASSASRGSGATHLEPTPESRPPRVDVSSDFPSKDALVEPSTFRAGLEKAVADINNKYGLPSNTCLADDLADTGASRLTDANSLPFLPKATFRPRYHLPVFTNAPPRTVRSRTGDLQELPPKAGADSNDADTKVASDGSQGGCHLPALLLDEVLSPKFELADFMMPEPAVENTVPSETIGCPAKHSIESASSKKSTATVVHECAGNSEEASTTEEEEQSDNEESSGSEEEERGGNDGSSDSEGEVHYEHEDSSGTEGEDHDLGVTHACPLPESTTCTDGHTRLRSNSDQPLRNPSGSQFARFEHDRSISDISTTDVRRLRSKSNCGSSEMYSDTISNNRHASGSTQVSTFQEDTAPSVSELVNKFRRMGSLPGTFPGGPGSSHPGIPTPFSTMRKASRGKQFATSRIFSSNDSEGNSGLVSNSWEALDNMQVVVPEAKARRSISADSGDAAAQEQKK